MKKLLRVNCLHRGELDNVKGKRWMVAVDGSEASVRAFKGVVELMDAERDHLLVVNVRDKELTKHYTLPPVEEVLLRLEQWRSAQQILNPFVDTLQTLLEPSAYTVIMPEAWDSRRMLCDLCKRYKIDTLCVGKHSESEHKPHRWHLRSLRSYTTKHAGCSVQVF